MQINKPGLIMGMLVVMLTTGWPARLLAQETDLAYDDGVPAASLSNLVAGDIELVRMTPAHPAEVKSLRFHFGNSGTACTAKLRIWADNGGNGPDLDQVLFQQDLSVNEATWHEVTVPAGTVKFEPPIHFYAGHIVGDPRCVLAWDNSGATENHSLARMGGNWYYINAGSGSDLTIDALIRAKVNYFNVLPNRHFENVSAAAGLPENMRRMAWGDYDNDGDDDLLVSGNRLFKNNGDGTFTEVTAQSGIGGKPTNGGVWADYDNDGHLDFYATVHNYLPECQTDNDCVRCRIDSNYTCAEEIRDHTCNGGRCQTPAGEKPHDILWHNNGDGTFTDVSEQAGRPYDFLPSEAAAWGDFDNDGHVDIYVANYEIPLGWNRGTLSAGTTDFLWRNNGDGTFSDVSFQAGIRIFSSRCGRGVAWVDFDGDGDQDIYVANYRLHFNYFWRNRGDGTFENISTRNGTAGVPIQGSYGHSIGATWADLDNDGDWDLFVANLAHPRFLDFSDKSMLYVNQGPPDYGFQEIRKASGITFSETHSDPGWGDYDNDGFSDLFITDVYVGYLAFLYKNNGNLTFTDVTYPSGILVDNGWGSAWADYNNDGRLDLAANQLWKNKIDPRRHWLKVRLHSLTSNRAAIGATARVTAGGRSFLRQVEGGKGTGNQNSLTLHFGLGDATQADQVVIRWPSGHEDTHQNVAADQTVTYWENGVEPLDGGMADGGMVDGGVIDGGLTDGGLTDGGVTPQPPASGCSCHFSGASGSCSGAMASGLLLLVLIAIRRLRRNLM